MVIAALGLLAALGAVLARNLVHAALFLVAFFFTIACQFVLLEAEFLAAIQVLIYIGAVAILLLFGIMLTRNIQGDETTTVTWPARVLGTLVSLAMLAVLVVGIGEQTGLAGRAAWSQMTARPEIPAPQAEAINNMGRAIGLEMMTRYVIAFEAAGLLLTAALVGAIAVALLEGPGETPRDGAIPAVRPDTTEG